MLAADTKHPQRVAPALTSVVSTPSWRRIVAPVEPFLDSVARRLVEQVVEFEPEIATYARYALANQGKQMRPALLALSAEAAGTRTADLVTLAAIVEMVHLATLVHDNIIDEARVRRGRPTLAVRSGNAVSVLLGDCLFAHALRLAATFPTPDVCRAVAAATLTVCSGETLQTLNEHRWELRREEYFRILRMKTGELFALSCELGGRYGGGGENATRALRAYGMALGTAYQVYDDCLDLYGRELDAGKSLGTDLAGGKPTLPVIVALERARGDDRVRLGALLSAYAPDHLPELLGMLERHHALAESIETIRGLCASARETLLGMPNSDGAQALASVADYLASQTSALET